REGAARPVERPCRRDRSSARRSAGRRAAAVSARADRRRRLPQPARVPATRHRARHRHRNLTRTASKGDHMFSLSRLVDLWSDLVARLRAVGEVVPRLILRLIMGWEFFEAGREKLHGENWFASIQSDFPYPFNVVPANLSWTMATWFELVGAVALW